MEVIEFIQDSHTYLIEGVIAPSVTQILAYKFKGKFDGIPKYILENAAERGTRIHKAIEHYEASGVVAELPVVKEQLIFDQYLKLKKENELNVVHQEIVMRYQDKFCGTFDMIADNKRFERLLIDIKCTAKLDDEYLSWQLGFYKMMYEETYKEKIADCYCLWLPVNNLGKFKQIKPKTKKQCLDLYKEYITREE